MLSVQWLCIIVGRYRLTCNKFYEIYCNGVGYGVLDVPIKIIHFNFFER